MSSPNNKPYPQCWKCFEYTEYPLEEWELCINCETIS